VRRSARCALAMEDERGKRKGVGVAWWRWSALCRRHGREWGTTRGWLYAAVRAGGGAWGRCGSRAAWCSRQRPSHGAGGWCTRERCMTSVKQGRGDAEERFEYNSNSNEFKLLQNLPNLTDQKIALPNLKILK
jgi:hypothetical protein